MQTIFNCGGISLDLSTPKVMGILNITPDSFYDGGFFISLSEQLKQVERMMTEGAAIIDIGAVSTRPGAVFVNEDEETRRLLPVLRAVRKHFPDAIVSVDTFRSGVAKVVIDNGAGMINDVYGGRFDNNMFEIIEVTGIPYIMMHMLGEPGTMQVAPQYKDVVSEVIDFFKEQSGKFRDRFSQVIIDPGFGFGKTVEHNFQLLQNLKSLKSLGFPILAGLSRKSMINKVIRTNPSGALNGTTVLNTIALINGVDLLRVHDVKEAVEAIALVSSMKASSG
jgi:dihydropteroate synthase